ncbi:hypothetical protein Tco_1118819 [Tanacetum coccineum]
MIHQQKIPPYQKKIWIICGLMYKEYFEKISFEVSINSAARTTLHNQDTPLSYSIIVEHNEDPHLVSSSEEQISPILNDEADELIQEEDSADLNGNTLLSLYHTPMFDKSESSLIAKDPSNIIFISQSQYTIELLKKHEMDECDSMITPMATARLEANLQGTPTDQTRYHSMIGRSCISPPVDQILLFQHFTSGGLQFLGEKLVSWSSKKQDCTALSTTKAEYVSLSACCAQVIWMRTQLLEYGYKFNKIPMYCDSKSAIAISCNPVQHSRTKHIDIQYHFIKEHIERGTVKLYFVET